MLIFIPSSVLYASHFFTVVGPDYYEHSHMNYNPTDWWHQWLHFQVEEDINWRSNKMDEERSLLLKQYCEYHSNNASGITQDSLVKQSREHLSSVKPKCRFMLLNSDSYINVLEKVATDLEGKEESFQKIHSGFKSLEQYGLNLWKFPWRKEYHTIKVWLVWKYL